jgi:DNA polymerase-3 subunit epsilon
MAILVRACARMQRLTALTAIEELVAARPDGADGWELAVVHRGRLTAAGVAARGMPPYPVVDALLASAEFVVPRPGPLPAALAEETELILRWLEMPGTRMVRLSEPWSLPARGAGRFVGLLATEPAARRLDPFADRRPMRTRPQPTRRW